MKKAVKTKSISTLNERLNKLMREKKLNIALLAEKAGVAIGTVQKLATDPTCNPTIASLEAICKVLETSISYLIGQAEKTDRLSGISVSLFELDYLMQDLLHFDEVRRAKLNEREFVQVNCNLSQRSFAIKMQGNSMLPLFPENTTLIFDQEKPYYDGSYVLVYYSAHDKVLFKQLLIDEPNLYTKSVNPAFKDNLVLLGRNDKIIATLVQSQMHY